MKLYGGIDLHSNNSYVALVTETGAVTYKERLDNDKALILEKLRPYQGALEGLVVESTYNWYWLVDMLQESGFSVHLANTSAISHYEGIKHTDDESDAVWLAQLLRLGLLKEGHIYPKEKRGLRELLRRRLFLVRQQTTNILGIQSTLTRYENLRLSGDKIKNSEEEELLKRLSDPDVVCAVKSQIKVLHCIRDEIKSLEKSILLQIKQDKLFHLLKTVPGIGPILAMTILLETGDISRFSQVGKYSSYCRCVSSKRISNGKKKGENNRKNGNAYLSWAFIEAANYAIRFDEKIKRYYQRKLAKTSRIVALKTIAHKLARACYFIMRDGVEFDVNKLISE